MFCSIAVWKARLSSLSDPTSSRFNDGRLDRLDPFVEFSEFQIQSQSITCSFSLVAGILNGVKSFPITVSAAVVNSYVSIEKSSASKDRMREVCKDSAPIPVSLAASYKNKNINPLPKRMGPRLGINNLASLAE
jgi:hypothetical protein